MQMIYGPTGAQKGSPLASAWLLVPAGFVEPKVFVCKSDPHAKKPGEMKDPSGKYYLNFQLEEQVSYSFAYPYSDGAPGAWWKNTTDSSLPIVADMAPLNGTGRPSRNVAPGSASPGYKGWNSGVHQGDGQNVGFADAHTEFVRRPDIGQSNDNIYSFGGTGGVTASGGTQPVKTPIVIKDTSVPFDIYMVPARNLDTGGL
jgi:hypothetical protein